MRRTDMDRNTLYAINASGVPKPGYVLDPGKVPSKVKVRVYWQWENQDEDYLNPQPSFTGNRNDERHVNTSDVLKPWSEYCMDLRVARAARLAEADAAKQAEKDAMDELDARIDAVGELLDAQGRSGSAYIDQSDLHYLARSGRIHDNRYSAMHVLRLVEAIMANYDRSMDIAHPADLLAMRVIAVRAVRTTAGGAS